MTELELSSGFTVKVRRLSPYYTDFIEQALPEIPMPEREVETIAGDKATFIYQPPKEQPDPDEEPYEYELFWRYQTAASKNLDIAQARARMRTDFLLSTCVEIVGERPVDINSNDWLELAEAGLNYQIPGMTEPKKRHLAFLKLVVIQSDQDHFSIMERATATEVSMQGISNALQSFRSDLGGENA